MKKIVSASRRTDLPRFHYEWLQTVLKKGEAQIVNPRFKDKTYMVDLNPESVHSLVLWSKDFKNVLADPGYTENYNLYFQYTINNYSAVLEPNVPEYRMSVRTLAGLLKKYRPEQFNIRFDPLIISTLGEKDPTPEKPGRARLSAFANLCRDLNSLGMNNSRVTTSHVCLYPHVKKRLMDSGLDMIILDEQKQMMFIERMVEIAAQYSLTLYSCASPVLEKVPGVQPGRCIDGQLLEQLFGGKVSRARDSGQRQACGCCKSVDIGSYDKECRFNCIYCYKQPLLN